VPSSPFVLPPQVPTRIPATRICSLVEARFALPPGTLRKNRSRERHIAQPRQIAMYLIRTRTLRSFPAIGFVFGMHHTTVIHSVNHVAYAMKAQPELEQFIADLNGEIDGLALRVQADQADRMAERIASPFDLPGRKGIREVMEVSKTI
jgi:hypothetical protein